MARLWLNEMTHERAIGDCPDPKATFWKHKDEDPSLSAARRSASCPFPKSDRRLGEWSEAPLWTALDECDSDWHRPHLSGRRQDGAKDACPYCGTSAKDDLARRRKLRLPVADFEKEG